MVIIAAAQQNTTQKHIERENEPCAISEYEIQQIPHLRRIGSTIDASCKRNSRSISG